MIEKAENFLNQFESLNIPVPGVRLPAFKIEEKYQKRLTLKPGASNFDFLRGLCLEGFNRLGLKKDSDEYKKYAERTKYELSLIEELGFTDYFLLVWDVINFCVEKDIAVGYGRGSCVGSLVLFLIDVTKVDPIKYGLFFERFISRARAKSTLIDGVLYFSGDLLPDIDNDVAFYRRGEVTDYLAEKFKGKTCKILTFNTLSSKLLIKEIGKIVGSKSEEEMTEVTSKIPKNHGIVEDIEEAYKNVEEFRVWCDKNPLVYQTALKLRDLIKNSSVHPSGILLSHSELEKICPTQLTSDNELVSSYDMNQVSTFAVKLDILGLRCVSVVDDVCKSLGIKMTDINVNDERIYQALQELKHPHGLFQVEAEVALKTTQKIKPKNLDELSVILSIARPGALQFVDKYANFTNNGIIEGVHPFFDDVLNKTASLCIYQEQAMKMANKIGFTLDESEQIRRCVTGDTLFVSKNRGYITINRLLKEGYDKDLFLTMDDLGNQTWQKISNIWSNGSKQTRYVEASNGLEVRTTKNHQFLTEKGWKARCKLTDDDYFVCPKTVDWDGEDYISEDMAIVITGLITEGYFSGYCTTTFTNFDKEIMDIFSNAFFKSFSKNVTIRPCGKVAAIKKQETILLNKYLHYGLSASKFFPEKMMGMTKETTRKFLSFALACEGGISQSNIEEQRWFEFCSKSKKLAQQVQLLFIRFGIYSKLRIRKNKDYGNFYSVLVKEYSQLKKIKEELTDLWPSIKKEQLNNLLETERTVNFSFDLIPQYILKKLENQYPSFSAGESGRVYTDCINRNTFQRLCAGTKDKNWIKLANNGNIYYNKFDSQERDTREVEVFDFTMENEDVPYIIANGLIIHNCIGKKKVEEIKTWESKIQAKIIENNLDKKIGEVFWKILNDSAGYQFNASHSYAYATLSAATVYLKFLYPTQFYLSLLKMTRHEPEPIQEIAKIHREMNSFGIKLLPPSLTRSNIDFAIEGKDIRFGLSSIKGVSEKTIEKIKNFKRTHENKFQLFEAAEEADINIGTVSSIIQAGMLEGFGKTRTLLVYEAQLWNQLSNKEKRIANDLGPKYNFELAKIVKAMAVELKDEKSKPLIKESRMETIKKKTDKYKRIYKQNSICESFANWWYEKELLGYVTYTTLLEIFRHKKASLRKITDVMDSPEGSQVDFVGVVDEDPTLGTTKTESKSKYARFSISDEYGTAKILIFNKSLEQCKDLNGTIPKEGDVVIVCGVRKGDDCVFANTIASQKNDIYTKLSELSKEDALD